jgi:hypothetical protein
MARLPLTISDRDCFRWPYRTVETALREIEIGRVPETAWELEVYAAAYAAGIVSRPLRTN